MELVIDLLNGLSENEENVILVAFHPLMDIEININRPMFLFEELRLVKILSK